MAEFLRRTSPLVGLLIAATWFVGGCASPPPPITLAPSFWASKDASVAIGMTALPEPGHLVSAAPQTEGLLGYAIGVAQAGPYTEHLRKQDFSRVYGMADKFAGVLAAKGVAATVLKERLDTGEFSLRAHREDAYADRDFTPLRSKVQARYLLLLQPVAIGTTRSQAIIAAVGPPSGAFSALGQLIDLSDNRVMWRKSVNVLRSVRDPWDEPPAYPNLTAAVSDALDAGMNQLFLDFTWFAR